MKNLNGIKVKVDRIRFINGYMMDNVEGYIMDNFLIVPSEDPEKTDWMNMNRIYQMHGTLIMDNDE